MDARLRGVPGVMALAGRSDLVAGLTARLDQLDAFVAEEDRRLEDLVGQSPDEVETASASLIALRDALWAVRNDRIRTARAVAELAAGEGGAAALTGFLAIQQTLSALDRLEVRGRDSAGIHLYVWDHGLDLADPAIAALISARATAIRCSRPDRFASPDPCSASCTRQPPRSASSATTRG